jgi:FkbM family methyltransferase
MNTHPSTVLGTADLVAIDVGARSDIPENWLVLDGFANFIAVEPDPAACEKLRAVYDGRGHGHRYDILPIAVSNTDGPRTLYVTNTASGASLLSHDTPINRAYIDRDYLFPITERTVQTRRLDSVLDERAVPRVDMMKIDVEGAALDVIEGLGDGRLGTLLQIEMETSTTEQFRGERNLFEIYRHLTARGFELMDMRSMRTRLTRDGRADGYQREVFGVHSESPTIAGRLLDVDAMFFKHPDIVLSWKSEAAVRRLAAAYCTYQFFCEAHAIFDRAVAAGIMAEADARAAQDGVVGWHNHHAVRKLFHKPTPFWAMVRQATKMVGMSDQVADKIALGEASEVVSKIVARTKDAMG